MKITGRKTHVPSKTLNPSADSDLPPKPLLHKPPRRKTKSPRFPNPGVRVKRELGPPNAKRIRPETPLLRWKFNDERENGKDENFLTPELGRKSSRKVCVGVSARKLAAGLWRLQLPENDGGQVPGSSEYGVAGHPGVPFHGHQKGKAHDCQSNDPIQSPNSVSGSRNGTLWKHDPSSQIPNSVMEGATKWDPMCWKTSNDTELVYGRPKLLDQQMSGVSAISALKVELEQARSRIHDLENERRTSKKKLEHFLKKLSEERSAWRSREHEKIRAIIDDIKADLSRERKNRQRMEMVHSKLVNELADAKLSAKRYMQDYEKERKARELIEEVCDELAKEIGEDKAEVEALKRESMKLREEVDDERKMLQLAEVWREERVQMKLVDAKVTLEEKYSQMKRIVGELETFLSSRRGTLDVEETRKAELLRQAAASVVNIQDMKEFTYEAPNPDDIFSVFEDIHFGEPNEREIEPCVEYSPASRASKIRTVSLEDNVFNKDNIQRHSNAYDDHNGDIEEDESGWETVSHAEDQGSSYSPNGSDPSVNKIPHDSNASGSGTEWEEHTGEETPITKISEVCTVPTRQLKVSSISRLWKSRPSNGENYKFIAVEGKNGRLSNGRLSNGTITSPDQGSGKDGLSPQDLTGDWSSIHSGNPHITRGTKGCIEWPRSMQKNSLKTKLLQARIESQNQKVQLRQVLKQKI